ncbi:molybdopterin-synthase adenylyltransferase MoeB [Georgenia sp. MJ206]|uniref:molybdopterin-synthase adenylyltransferase MoeB n=1 Tax=Georgenia wangjunii TaxID=3117730 RepID=UPI002F261CD3
MRLAPLVEPAAALTTAQVQRYSRHLLLGQVGVDGQRRLLGARVLVVGAGGLGSPALLYLAAAGVGHLGIVDDDDVETSNLQRQVIHTTADVGRPKVDSAAERVAALNPDVVVTRHHVRLDAGNARDVIAGYDVVLDGTDNFPTRYLVDDVCAQLGVPLVWGSILRFDAQVSVFWSRPRGADDGASGSGGTGAPPGVRLRDLFPVPPPPGTTPSCGEAGVLGAMCGQVGSIMAAEAVKLVTGAGEPLLGRVLVLDVLTARWTEVPLRAGAHHPEEAAAADRTAAPRHTAEITGAGTPSGAHGDGSPSAGEPGGGAVAGAPFATISATALAERLTARERGADDLVLLDVREAAERTIVAIPGAVHVPLREVLADAAGTARRFAAGAADPIDVVVHCRSGQRSAQAARALAGAGVRTLNLEGGVLAWVSDVDPTLPTY